MNNTSAPRLVAERQVDTPTIVRLKQARAKRQGSRFLKGPVPVPVLQRLAGAALKTYLLLRHRRDLTGRPTVTVPEAELQAWELPRRSYHRALEQLVADGLVAVERRPGRPVRVTLRD